MVNPLNQNHIESEVESDLAFSDPKGLRILIVRPDRLGDVILSTPVFEVIKNNYSKAHVTALVQKNVVPILKDLTSVDHLMIFDPKGRHAGVRGFFRLVTEIRRRRFRIAVVLQSQSKIAAALFFAGIRYRVGPWSKIHSFLFYNHGVRQMRSHVEMHEADYNLQLLRRLGIRAESRRVPTRVAIPEGVRDEARAWLQQKGWTPQKKLIVVHPGMGGSALNWPESHYQELVNALADSGKQVLITGGPTESATLDKIASSLGSDLDSKSGRILFYRGDRAVDFLGGLFSFADLVVAPSTGPLHLAVALDRPVVTFFPPIRVQSAIRWGPYLADESRASVLVPEVYCGQDFRCLGSLCHYFPCMKSLSVKKALNLIERIES